MFFSEKQKEFLGNATHRWNVKTGATRSGKTYLDYFVIPKRIRACRGSGLIVLLGNTVGTLSRNILDPMREIWGGRLVGTPGNNNTVKLFGKKCYVLGADKVSQVARLQGAGIEYCYGDEITTWHPDVFNMLKSRMDKPYSRFDGTCNPDNPNHWFKQFLDREGTDIYQQAYTIDDNPFLDPNVVENLKSEYAGTVYYDRFILGRWMAAEGIIYRRYADAPAQFEISREEVPGEIMKLVIGVDFGGTKSGTAFVATAILPAFDRVVVLASERHMSRGAPNSYGKGIDPDDLGDLFVDFVARVEQTYGRIVEHAFCDNAEPILIRGLAKTARSAGLAIRVQGAAKTAINDRIRLTTRLLAQNRLFLTSDCATLSKALSDALWDAKKFDDVRLDDGTTDIDTLDAFEYTIERYARHLVAAGGGSEGGAKAIA